MDTSIESTTGLETRILVLTPSGRDEALAASELARAGFSCWRCSDMGGLCAAIEEGAGAVLLAEEALSSAASQDLALVVARQPPWSDLPIVLLMSGRGAESPVDRERFFEVLGNVTLLERPMAVLTLVSALRAALRARRRQFAARELLREREEQIQNRDRFLAMLGHELRNPLNAILMSMQLIERGIGDRTRQREIVRHQAEHLARLVDDLLDVSRVTSGKIVLHPAPVDLKALLERAVRGLEGSATSQGVRLKLEEPPPIPVTLSGDGARLEQVIVNLLTNAIKYTPAGGRIDTSLRIQDRTAIVLVRDTGIGIAHEDLNRVFEPFAQVSTALERSKGGMGLGLTLVRALVTLHHGTVAVRSPGLGQGTEVEVRLPVSHAVVPIAAAKGEPVPILTGGDRLVLIVEDNPDSREVLRMALAAFGYKVEEAADGPTGVSMALHLHPRTALIDIGLPGLDGYEVARQIRAGLGKEIRLFAVTGYGQPGDRRRAAEAGFDRHLTKPVDLDTLAHIMPSSAQT